MNPRAGTRSSRRPRDGLGAGVEADVDAEGAGGLAVLLTLMGAASSGAVVAVGG
ncbi:hypothetical protein [uncultured Pseudokineococcus sp.]|uniref:hypothetical protein n=1 Tax=uncultured Pseudokineococcus sp. TaxID=1642928 RepID=UPI0026295C4A|nr:hypothetical protein [uncultured Pseudokineococcus sp.]